MSHAKENIITFTVRNIMLKGWFLRLLVDSILLIASVYLGSIVGYLLHQKDLFSEALMPLTSESINVFHSLLPIYLATGVIVFVMSGLYGYIRRQRKIKKYLMIIGILVAHFVVYSMILLAVSPEIIIKEVQIASFIFLAMFALGIRYIKWLFIKYDVSDIPDVKIDGNQIVVIIGGAGYIGSLLCEKLLKKGYYVRLLDSFMYGHDSIKHIKDHKLFEVHEGDFRHIEKLVKVVKHADVVVHLGGLVGDPACAVDEEYAVEINHTSTVLLKEICKGYGIKRFLFASSCSVYGVSDDYCTETSKLNPVSLYARTKIASEECLLSDKTPDFHPIIMRFATVFGLSHRPRFDLIVNLLTARALTKGNISIFGDWQYRPFIHVGDLADGIIKLVEAPLPKVSRQIFNIGDNQNNMTLGDVSRLVKKHIPEVNVDLCEGREDARNYKVSFDKFQKLTGFKAKYSVEAGIEQMISFIQKHPELDVDDISYNNVAFLKKYLKKFKGKSPINIFEIDVLNENISDGEKDA